MSGIAMLSSLRKKTCATYKGNHKHFSSSWTLSASLSLEKPPPALQLSIIWVQHSNSNIYRFGSNIVASWVTLTTTDTITPSPLVSSAAGNSGSAALSLSFCNAAKWEEFTVTWKYRKVHLLLRWGKREMTLYRALCKCSVSQVGVRPCTAAVLLGSHEKALAAPGVLRRLWEEPRVSHLQVTGEGLIPSLGCLIFLLKSFFIISCNSWQTCFPFTCLKFWC